MKAACFTGRATSSDRRGRRHPAVPELYVRFGGIRPAAKGPKPTVALNVRFPGAPSSATCTNPSKFGRRHKDRIRCAVLISRHGHGPQEAAAMPSGWSGQILVQAEDIPLRIFEPGRLLGAEHADVIDRLQARQVVVGKAHAARFERR